jgi:HTH-type transcriptional regulator / antitoxin HigA
MTVKITDREKKAIASARTLPGSYFALVKRFPLIHVKDDAHLKEATGVIDRLLRESLDEGGQEYLDALTDLVETYEAEHVTIPDASEADVLHALIRASGLTQPSLAKQVGIAQSTISAVLNGSRSLTKEQVATFSRFFQVSPAAFFPA